MKTTIIDDRTPEQRVTHTRAYGGIDVLFSPPGRGGASYIFWAFRPEDRRDVIAEIDNRRDIVQPVEIGLDGQPPDIPGCVRCHICVWRGGAP